jgi:N-methylhydantoinase A
MRFAVDTGGTFTDLLVDTGEGLRMFKASTTPEDPVDGVFASLKLAAADLGMALAELLAGGEVFVHGTTRAINALVTQTTAKTAFLVTEGHRDILLFREGGRADAFDFSHPYPAPLVPRRLTFEVPERTVANGSILRELDEPRVIDIANRLRAVGIEAVAVTLLWSIVNPKHELRVAELLEEHLPNVPCTLSHRVNPTIREFRRASSACIDASLKPLMTRYMESLTDRLVAAGFAGRVLIVTSQGGVMDASDVAGSPIHSINSGPSMAPVAGLHYSSLETDLPSAVVADTGGTTFDVSLIRAGHVPRTRETWIGPEYRGHITGFPSVDVRSVGAGGGSVAWVDGGGLLRVGPESAGAVPGPVCYGAGGIRPTVTDASLILGFLDADFFLGGRLRLDREAAERSLYEHVAEPLRLDLMSAAAAVLTLSTENMVHAIEEITVNQGVDPRRAVLVAGGGAAGLNIVSIARRLNVPRIVLPETGAALSAAGALLSKLASDYTATFVTTSAAFDGEGVRNVIGRLRRSADGFLKAAGDSAKTSVELFAEARYPHQVWELEIPLDAPDENGEVDAARVRDRFHAMHNEVFGISDPDSPVEIVTWRMRAQIELAGDAPRMAAAPSAGAERVAGQRPVYFPNVGWLDTAFLLLDQVEDGQSVSGPAIIESSFTTIVLDSGCTARKSPNGNLVIDIVPLNSEASTRGDAQQSPVIAS